MQTQQSRSFVITYHWILTFSALTVGLLVTLLGDTEMWVPVALLVPGVWFAICGWKAHFQHSLELARVTHMCLTGLFALGAIGSLGIMLVLFMEPVRTSSGFDQGMMGVFAFAGVACIGLAFVSRWAKRRIDTGGWCASGK